MATTRKTNQQAATKTNAKAAAKSVGKTASKAAVKKSAQSPAKPAKKTAKPTSTRPAAKTPAAKKTATTARKTVTRSSVKPDSITPATEVPVSAPIVALPETAASTPRPTRAPRESSAQARVIAMMSAPEGATLDAIMNATGWQAHTVRGFISGAVRKKLGLTIESMRVDGKRTYRVAE